MIAAISGSIPLSEDDVNLLRIVIQYKDVFVPLVNNVIGMKNGSLTLHFNEDGYLMYIDKNQKTYRRLTTKNK